MKIISPKAFINFEIIFILEMVRKSILSKKILGDLIIDFIGFEKRQII